MNGYVVKIYHEDSGEWRVLTTFKITDFWTAVTKKQETARARCFDAANKCAREWAHVIYKNREVRVFEQ